MPSARPPGPDPWAAGNPRWFPAAPAGPPPARSPAHRRIDLSAVPLPVSFGLIGPYWPPRWRIPSLSSLDEGYGGWSRAVAGGFTFQASPSLLHVDFAAPGRRSEERRGGREGQYC